MSHKPLRNTLLGCLGLGLPAAIAPSLDAATLREAEAGIPAPTGIELIAFEAPGCIYCPVFRRDVAPSYAASKTGKEAPLRFVDVNDPAAESFHLAGPVRMVPTVVLVRDGVEIGRINGYVGREGMHRLLEGLLPPE
ncbi:MAG: thioredoxin family protein [Hyphomicrobium sp.]|uniref:thioredoxin family protein n=1 Tax=Hyphomicrobium sp. TaxID=82 RepID=UPI003D123BE3